VNIKSDVLVVEHVVVVRSASINAYAADVEIAEAVRFVNIKLKEGTARSAAH